MSVRKVSSRGGNVIGSFPSIKMGRMIAFESLLERDFIYLLDYDSEVEWFEEQPLTIEYLHEGKIRRYTPDFHLVERGGHHVLVECKPERFVSKSENRRRFIVAHDWCAQRGWEFRVVTDLQVRAGFRLPNVKLLTRYARQVVGPATRGRVYTLLRDSGTRLTIDDVAQAISPDTSAGVASSILHMAFHHEVVVPLDDAPISGEMSMCLPSPNQERRKA